MIFIYTNCLNLIKHELIRRNVPLLVVAGNAIDWGGVLLKEGKEQEEGVAASMENLKYLEEEIRGKKFFGGETIGLADIALGWLAYYLDIFEEIVGLKLIDQEKFPCLAAWKQEFANAPIIHENWPDRDKLVNKFAVVLSYCLSSTEISLKFHSMDKHQRVSTQNTVTRSKSSSMDLLLVVVVVVMVPSNVLT
ncbi:hypothetical protein OIU78_020081 [Salix suchowensis]|nr:hypothetical protein OIU78_020081 [Salix suchowensis]